MNLFMKNFTLLTFLLFSISNFAQIKGTVSDENGNPLPFVSVFEENTYNSTTSNEQGKYQLNVKEIGKNKIIFQFLGYKAQKLTIQNTSSASYTLDVKLQEENVTLNEVIINPKNNPANDIIKSAIANKKENAKKTQRYSADFYSKGLFKIKDLPKMLLITIKNKLLSRCNGDVSKLNWSVVTLEHNWSCFCLIAINRATRNAWYLSFIDGCFAI